MTDGMNGPIRHQDLKRMLFSKELFAGRNYTIECNNAKAIPYLDLYELYFTLCFMDDWKWRDLNGNTALRQSLGKILWQLGGDFLRWPWIFLNQSRTVHRLQTGINHSTLFTGGRSVLFLRTDHWFNMRSGGSVGHLQGVINGLRDLGYTVNVVSTDYLTNIAGDRDFHFCEPVYRAGRNLPNIPELLYNRQLVSFIGKKWREWSPAVIYQRYSLGNYSGAWLKEKYQIPYICEYNGSFPWMTRNWGGRRLLHEKLFRRIETVNLQAADIVVAVSRALQADLIVRGIPAEKILVNPNGVDPGRYSPEIDGSLIRRQYRFTGKTVVGFIGTFGKWHGAEILAEAFGRLISIQPALRQTARLLLIGDGPTMPLVRERLAKYGITDICAITGLIPQDAGPSYLAACDILASPQVPNPDGTPFFGSPTKLFEYMAMGKGIIASALDQIGEILKHGQTAWMVKPGDIESLVSGLKILIHDPELRNQLGRAARNEVLANYTWKDHTRKIIAKLEGLK
jgi:glycosyltransferase involved in cell wall biosynthesis